MFGPPLISQLFIIDSNKWIQKLFILHELAVYKNISPPKKILVVSLLVISVFGLPLEDSEETCQCFKFETMVSTTKKSQYDFKHFHQILQSLICVSYAVHIHLIVLHS